MRVASRLATIAAAALALTLASTAVAGTRLEVQDWDCPPAPASCARPVEVRGFPVPYLSDYHGISPVGRASLVSAVLGEDHFRAGAFFANLVFYAIALGAAWSVWTRVAHSRAARRGARDERRPRS